VNATHHEIPLFAYFSGLLLLLCSKSQYSWVPCSWGLSGCIPLCRKSHTLYPVTACLWRTFCLLSFNLLDRTVKSIFWTVSCRLLVTVNRTNPCRGGWNRHTRRTDKSFNDVITPTKKKIIAVMCCNTLRKHAGLIRMYAKYLARITLLLLHCIPRACYKFWPVRCLVELGLESAGKLCLTHIIVWRILYSVQTEYS
jgi:hypothetical protein